METTIPESPSVSNWLSYHQNLVENIKYAKSQQWRLAYYILLLLAGVIGLSRTLGAQPQVSIILFLIAVALAVAGTHFLLKFQNDLTRYRKNIKKVREKFPVDLQELSAHEPAEGDPSYYTDFLYLLVSVIWVATALVAWVIGFVQLVFCR